MLTCLCIYLFIVEDAIEKLFTLSNNSLMSATERVSQKRNGIESTDSPEMVVPDGWSMHSSAIGYDGIDEISVGYQPPKQSKPGLSQVGQRLVDSGDSLLHANTKATSDDLSKEQKHQQNENDRCINGESSISHDLKTSEFSEPFQEFKRKFLNANSSSDEWNSVKHHQSDCYSTGTKDKKELTKQENIGAQSCRTQNANDPMNINDSIRTNSWGKPETSVRDMKQSGRTSLPMWPDEANHLNQPFGSQPIQNRIPYLHAYNSQHFNPYQQKQPQMISLTQNYGPPFHPHAGHYSGQFANQVFNVSYHQSNRQHIRQPQQTRQQELAPRFCSKNS